MASTLTKEVLSKYPNLTYVETGTYKGESIDVALACGFQNIISIEVDRQLYEDTVNRFRDFPNIRIIHGDSGKILYDAIRYIDGSITFWLDAHMTSNSGIGDKACPVLEELGQIARHDIKNHTILVDDMRLFFEFNDDMSNIKVEDLKNKIIDINRMYNFKYENSTTKENDILVAEL